MPTPDDVLAFWLDEVEPKQWYIGSSAFDATVRDRFEETWERAMDGALSLWLTYPSGTLAYVLLTDQFTRNMFRDTPKAFASDDLARAAAKMAVGKRWDLKIDEPARQFFYMPLVHSECLTDQDRAVRLIAARMEDGDLMLLHARAHREVIRQYGRFPTRNEALGRKHRGQEDDYISKGGYGAIVDAMKEAPAQAV